MLLLDIPRLRSARDRSVAPAAGVSVFGFRLEELLLDIPRLRSARDRSVVPAAGVFFLLFSFGGFVATSYRARGFNFPSKWHHQRPRGFHPAESGKVEGVSDFFPFSEDLVIITHSIDHVLLSNTFLTSSFPCISVCVCVRV